MPKIPAFKRVGTIVLVSAVLASTFSILVAPAAKAAVPIATYPASKVHNIVESANITAATYNAGTVSATYTTATKNLFAFSPTQNAYTMYVTVEGIINPASGCNFSLNQPQIYNDGFNTPYDTSSVTSTSSSGGYVTYTVANIGDIIIGETVYVNGAATAGFNGTFTVTAVNRTAKTFTVLNPATGSSTGAFVKHLKWYMLTGVTDYTFTVALVNPNAGGTCIPSFNLGSIVTVRDAGFYGAEKSSNMATDATGSTIFMATGSHWPRDSLKEGVLYISRNSGISFSRVDLVDQSGNSIGDTPMSNPAVLAGYNSLYGCQHRTCLWNSVSMSANGLVIAATSFGGEFVYSTDGGYHWTEVYREKRAYCSAGGYVQWQQVLVTKDAGKITAISGATIFNLDLTRSNVVDVNAVLPFNPANCTQNTYTSTTNPSVYASNSTDAASIDSDLRTGGSLYAVGANQSGSTLIFNYGYNRTVQCSAKNGLIGTCALAPAVETGVSGTTIAWSTLNIMAIYISNSGQYITMGGFKNLFVRSEDYGKTFQVASDDYNPNHGSYSSLNVGDCGSASGIISIAGSDDGRTQIFVTQTNTTSYYPNELQPGVCKSTNYGVKGSWQAMPVAIYSGSSEDISRKQIWTSVVVGSTGAPMYLGSSGVNQYSGTATLCNSTYPELCSPYFWSSFGVTGPPTLATPTGTPISGLFYSTVNPPSGAAANISWTLGRTSNGSAVSGISIASNGTLTVSASVAIGAYPMSITGTDNGSAAAIDMVIYVYDPNRAPPTFDTPVSNSTGYTVNITNYDPDYNWSTTSDTGTVSAGTPVGSVLPLTLTGIAPSSPAVITASSFMGTLVTTQYSILSRTVTGYSTGPQTALTITSEPTVAAGGTRTLTTSGGSGLGAVSYAVTTAGNAGCSISGAVLSVTSVTSGNTCGVTATKAANGSYLSVSSSEQTITVKTGGLVPIFDSPTRTATGFVVRITNYSASYTWTITTSAGSVAVSSPSGSTETITVTSLAGGASATVSATTSRTNYTTETSTVTAVALKAVTVQASSPTFIRGTTINETFTTTTLIGSDVISSVTFTFSGNSPTSYGPSTSAPSGVGTYQAVPSAAVFGVGSSSNYIITYLPGTLTIIVDPLLGGDDIVITISPIAKATYVTITATTAYAGRVALKANNRKIVGCSSILTVNLVAICRWRPSTHGEILLVGTLTPTDVGIAPSSYSIKTYAGRRATARS
jgi:hypothetical protein